MKADGPGKPTRHPLRQEPSSSFPGASMNRDARRAARVVQQPSPFTFKGTVSYIVGRARKVAIVDPVRKIRSTARALLDAVRGEDRHAYFRRHPYPPRSFARRAGDQIATGAIVLAEARIVRARAPCRRRAAAGILQRHRFQARPGTCRRRGSERRGWDARSRDTRPAIPPTTRRSRSRRTTCCLRRSRHGLVDPRCGAAGRLDGRLHDLAAEAVEADRAHVFPRPRARREQCAAFRRRVYYILHRKAREASILNRLQNARATFRRWSTRSIRDARSRLVKAAGMSVLAHLEDLVARGAVAVPTVRPPLPAVNRLA